MFVMKGQVWQQRKDLDGAVMKEEKILRISRSRRLRARLKEGKS